MEFTGGEITEFTANIIAELMHAPCDINGDDYLLLESLVNHRKDDSALGIENQKVVIKWRKTLRKSTAGEYICCKFKDGSTL